EAAPVRSSYFTMPPSAEAVSVPPVASPEPVAVAVEPAAPAAADSTPGLPKVKPYVLSIAELEEVARDSGLEWVNSDSAKVAAAQAAIAAEPRPIHVPREPKPVPVIDEGPLVLVETRRDLRQVTLPFEQV
ncbi:hypothetical protein RZS08_10645, partial [Arthrospira platensis SPKY1]|nr:hypothetical protein [Arthrospira platensis SPKY1]